MADKPTPSRFRPIIRVFVSSTFSDLVHERNALQNRVWPELERQCQLQGFQFQAIDLRWGVPTEAGLDHRTMRICFDELQRAQDISPQPNFLILLGDRYGWQPLPEQIAPAEFKNLYDAAESYNERRVLELWYRLDTNQRPATHHLRSRLDSPDGQDYTRNSASQDTPAWLAVQTTLWSVINRAYPVTDLARRFEAWNAATKELPSIVRFQGSATEQEIWQGAFAPDNAANHVLAFARQIDNLDQFSGVDGLKSYVNVDASGAPDNTLLAAIAALKAKLRSRLGPNYIEGPGDVSLAHDAAGLRLDSPDSHLDFLCREVHQKLWQIIQRQIEDFQRSPPASSDAHLSPEVLRDLQREREEHARFATERAPPGVFVGREAEKAKILEYLQRGGPRPFVLHGVSGSGKTALMAHAAREANWPGLLIQRFLGISRQSSDLRSLLIDLCQSLREHFPRAEDLPTEIRLLETELYEQLQQATAERPICVLLDALDQLDPSEEAHSLWWIPSTPLPPHARLVLSCLSDPEDEVAGHPYAVLRQRGFVADATSSAGILDLSPAEARDLWCRWLDRAKRELTVSQQEAIDAHILRPKARACRQPLYLKILFEESRQWRTFDAPPESLGASVPELLDALFKWLESPAVHGPLVEPAMAYLASARYGLSEIELLEVLWRDADYKPAFLDSAQHALPPDAKRIPIAIWSRLRYDLAPYLAERGAPGGTVLGLYHRQVGNYVRQRFANTTERSYQWHRRLALYFARQPWWLESRAEQRLRMPPYSARQAHVRKATELSQQLFALAKYAHNAGSEALADEACTWIERLFQKLPFLEAKNESGRVFELAGEFAEALRMLPESRPSRRHLKLLDEALRRDIHFIYRHREDYPQGLFQCLWNHTWWYDSPQAAEHYETGQEPGGVAGANLHRLLEHWREEKKSAGDFHWLRTLRPPAIHLGTAQRAVLRGHERGVTSVCFSPDGTRIVSGSLDRTARVWDAASGIELAILRGREDWVTSVSSSADGVRITVGGHVDWVRSVSYSPDGSRIVCGYSAQTLRLWDAANGAELAVLRGHESWVNSAVFSPDGRRIVSGSSDNTVRVWDTPCGAELTVLRGHGHSVTSVAYSPDGQQIASGSADNTVRVWDATSGDELVVLRGHEEEVTSVSYSPDGSRIVSTSGDQSVRVWDAASGVELAVLRGHDSPVTSVSYSPDGARIVSGSYDRTLRMWDAASGAELAVLRGHDSPVTSVSYSPDGARIVSGSDDKTARVWDGVRGAELAVLRGHETPVNCLCYSPNGARIVSGSNDETVRVWDAVSGAELLVLRGHEDAVTCVSYSADGSGIVSGGGLIDQTIRVWDAVSGVELAVLRGHEDKVTSVSFSPDNTRVVSGSRDNTVRVWDAASGAELVVLRGHEDSVTSVSYTPDGSRIVSRGGFLDQTVRVWDAQTFERLEVIEGCKDEAAIVREAQECLWKSVARNQETVVELSATRQPIAWFAEPLNRITALPSGRAWAGILASCHLQILQLEGPS